MSNTNLIHQTFHGYSNGHKLLASSIDLDSKIKNILLSESDSPGQEFHHKDNVCYTGYPIVEYGYYVLSKTWVATEIERPGCVWTHSILVPFSLLAHKDLLKHFNPFDNFIKKEGMYNLSVNLEPIQFNINSSYTTHTSDNTKELSLVFSHIFSTEKQVFIPQNLISVSDIIIMWSSLWPKLRRSFSFKTWSPKMSSSRPYYHKYSLLLNDYIYDEIQSDNWAEAIFSVDNSDVNNFMWKHGASLDNNKKNVHSLLTCWSLLKRKQFDDLSMFILKWKKTPISLVKDISKILTPNDISKSVAYFLSTYILIITNDDISDETLNEIGNLLLKIDPKFLTKILESNTEHARSISVNHINELSIEVVTELYNRSVYQDIDIYKPEIISEKYFWDNCHNSQDLFENIIRIEKLTKYIPINEFSPCDQTISNVSKEEILKVLLYKFDYLNNDWISYLLDNQEEISINQELLNEKNRKLGSFIISTFKVSTLQCFPDEVISYLYLHVKKDKTLIFKAALILTSYGDTDKPKLLRNSFDDICYLVSMNDLSIYEKNHLRNNIKQRVSNYTFQFSLSLSLSLSLSFSSLRDHFIVFSALFAMKNNIPTNKLTSYKSNLFELNRIVKKSTRK